MTTTLEGEGGWHFVGKHRLRFEPPDVIVLSPDGDMSLSEHRELVAFVKAQPQPAKGFFSLIDVARGGRADPATLKEPDLLEFMKKQRGAVYFNAAFYHRTLIAIFQRAAKYFKQMPEMPVHVFQTEAEARAWIEEERSKD